MEFNISDKLKNLRKEKGVSQEKFAQYLNVSFQAVSKWENGNACPDISLLPDIARFFGITIDELLQVEKLDEKKLFCEYKNKAEELFSNKKYDEMLELWIVACREMPNNIDVKEMLMSSYYDADKIKYQKEIIELGVEIYNSDAPSYYKGQAIREIANTYAANGNIESAKKWASKSFQIMHSQDILFTEILDGDEMLHDISFCTYWFFESFAYMAMRIDNSKTVSVDLRYKQDVYKTVSQLYEVIYRDDDMSFESLKLLYMMYRRIAELEIELDNDESVVQRSMERALECVVKSMSIQEHDMTFPMLYGLHIQATPSDDKQLVCMMTNDLDDKCFDEYRNTQWFAEIDNTLSNLL